MVARAAAGTRINSNWEHLSDELELLDAYLLREVRRRTDNSRQSQVDQLQGLVLSEQEILAILTEDSDQKPAVPHDAEADPTIREVEERISRRRSEGDLRKTPLLNQLTLLFQLERIEEQCVTLCLAAEIDPKYSKVFAFLQDDVTKKQPSVDLALKLFCNGTPGRLAARAIFSPNSALLRKRLLHLSEPTDRHSALPQLAMKLDDRIAAFLLETPQLDECLVDWVELVNPGGQPLPTTVPTEIRDRTIRLVESCFAGGAAPIRPLIHLYGRRGSGRRSLAECASQQIGLPLLVADVSRLPSSGRNAAEALWRLGRESLLLPAVVFIEHFDDLLQEGRSAELTALQDAVHDFSPLTFFSGTQGWNAESPRQLFLSLECPVPDSTARIDFWRQHLSDASHELNDDNFVELASKFNFTEGQIGRAVRGAVYRAYWDNNPPQALTTTMLSQAGRRVATPTLGGLARKVELCHSWSDIVLPETQLAQLREIVAHVKRAQGVFESWGFARKFPYGRGVTALFEGLSGTGKTMAAGIIGAALELDLYKIDLACVVSKYIGETEKNLDRIFAEAQDSNAILFFDEADALFGKRSEVKDAHDRYANVETAFLLQRIEDYSGIVILATNMKQNLDEAFVRRMRFIINFPFPNDDNRQRIWENVFPDDAPVGKDVDFRWLARKLKITGGNIKNISLRAAFLAIERQGVIGMDCLIEAAKRENEKIGKVSALADFRGTGSAAETLEIAEVA